MADDFIGVPYPVWSDLEARSRFASFLAMAAILLLALLVGALVHRGVLTGWADLFDFAEKPLP